MDPMMEEMMAGMFAQRGSPGGGGAGAPGFMDPRQRNTGSTANPGITLSRLIPMLLGMRPPNMAGNAAEPPMPIGGPNIAPGAQSGMAVNQSGTNGDPGAYFLDKAPGNAPGQPPPMAMGSALPRGPKQFQGRGLASLLGGMR